MLMKMNIFSAVQRPRAQDIVQASNKAQERGSGPLCHVALVHYTPVTRGAGTRARSRVS